MKYRTIVADPPWSYKNDGNKNILTTAKSMETHPAYQYERMSIADISALPVEQWADRNAHLYLWVTNPLVPEIGPIIEAWGFTYVTLLTWHKLGTLGMGYYWRGDTEHVAFGVRGKLPIAPALRQRNWFAAKKTGHSRKPDRFYELVERVSPGPYLELFARRRRYGWDVWGNEAPEEAASQAEMGLLA